MTLPDPARTRTRAFWGDARFFIGIVLIVASIAGVWFVVTAARQTVPVLAAAGTIVPGQVVTADDVRTVEVVLGPTESSYLSPEALHGTVLADGAVATRTIEAGELIPETAIGPAAGSRLTTVVVRSSTDVPSGIKAGSAVEVWAAPMIERGLFDTPSILVADATVAAVTPDDSMIGGRAATLEIVIARADVAKALEAVAAESAISVVPAAAGR